MRNSAIAAGLTLAIAALFALGQARAADQIESDGKCYVNTSNGNYEWSDCQKQAAPRAAAVKHGPRARSKKKSS
jgi:hypothetical protein